MNPRAIPTYGVVIDGAFDSATTGGVIFSAATVVDANTIAQLQEGVRRR